MKGAAIRELAVSAIVEKNLRRRWIKIGQCYITVLDAQERSTMQQPQEALMTVQTLVNAAAKIIEDQSLEQDSARVTPVPQIRTVRYYTTHGLLDGPARLDGRRALYSRRHLLQLLAIKQLQARGLDLAQVQAHLLGLTDDALATLARVSPALLDATMADATSSPNDPEPPSEPAFWMEQPVDLSPTPPKPLAPRLTLSGVRLATGVTLLIEGASRPLDARDEDAIASAALTLLNTLRARGLI
jgi:hypothetical protein